MNDRIGGRISPPHVFDLLSQDQGPLLRSCPGTCAGFCEEDHKMWLKAIGTAE